MLRVGVGQRERIGARERIGSEQASERDRMGQMEKDRIRSGNLEGSNQRTEQRMGTILPNRTKQRMDTMLPNRTDKGWSTDPGMD